MMGKTNVVRIKRDERADPEGFPTPEGFPLPKDSSPMGHWAAYFAQNPLRRWQDIADGLGTTRASAQASGRKWGLRHGFPVPPRR
jgi:hypothetical protein